jgi:hypothetical protein
LQIRETRFSETGFLFFLAGRAGSQLIPVFHNGRFLTFFRGRRHFLSRVTAVLGKFSRSRSLQLTDCKIGESFNSLLSGLRCEITS